MIDWLNDALEPLRGRLSKAVDLDVGADLLSTFASDGFVNGLADLLAAAGKNEIVTVRVTTSQHEHFVISDYDGVHAQSNVAHACLS